MLTTALLPCRTGRGKMQMVKIIFADKRFTIVNAGLVAVAVILCLVAGLALQMCLQTIYANVLNKLIVLFMRYIDTS